MCHDTLLDKLSDRDDYKPLIPLSLHTRFTKAWTNKHERYKWVSRTLELIRFTELVIEMGLRRRVSSKTKWRTIVTLEFVK
jgi:peroxin-16